MAAPQRLEIYFETHDANGPLLALRPTGSMQYPWFEHCDVVQPFKPDHDALVSKGYTLKDAPEGSYQTAIVHLTRTKQLDFALIAQAYRALQLGGTLLIDGQKTDGIESILKTLRKLLPIGDTLSKAHGKIFWITRNDAEPAEFSTWIKELDPIKRKHGFLTSTGVFSAGSIDAGSQSLIDALPDDLTGDIADLGAGWGWLSHNVLEKNPKIKSMHLFEANKIALGDARRNVPDERAQFHWEDVMTMIPKQAYQTVISNPPFHVTRKADPDLGRGFIAKAAKMLMRNGRFYMVANRHLAYENTLDAHFSHWEITSQSGQFKTFCARKPKA